MTFGTLIRRNLRFHWRTHLGVTLGAAVGSAALLGALIVGDSVRGTLRERALSGLGHGSFLLFTGDRLFAEHLPERMRCWGNVQASQAAFHGQQQRSSELPVCIHPGKPLRTMLLLRGTAARADGAARANHIQVIGVSDFAPVLFPAAKTAGPDAPRPVSLTNQAVANAALASRLQLRPGETVLVRVASFGRLSPEAAIAPRDRQTAALRLAVHSVVTNTELARFSPTPAQSEPPTIFVPLAELARAAELPRVGESLPVNTCLLPEIVQLAPEHLRQRTKFQTTLQAAWRWIRERLRGKESEQDHPEVLPLPLSRQLAEANGWLAESWGFDSVQMGALAVLSDSVALTSPRVFLDPPLARAALAVDTNARPVLTYLANLLRAGTNATPYSMVTAAGPPWTPPEMRDDEILVNQWLADDLRVKPGDEISLVYFDPESGARLIERTNFFRVRGVVPMEPPWADRTLMPDFPGIEKAESTRDWDAGFPLVYKIRPKDEDYWKQRRGTPKAFVTLAAGRQMWANRFGELTAIRFPIPTPATNTAEYCAWLERRILANLKPEELGLRFEPVREQALRAAEQSQDFGGLFLGFSIFLIASALLLMALLFRLGLEQRAPEIGTLLALGFTPGQVRRLLLGEGAALALLGGLLGALGALGYARAMLHGLNTVWRDAVGGARLDFHLTAQSLAIGLLAATAVAVLTLGLGLRRFVKLPARALLAGELEHDDAPSAPGGSASGQRPARSAKPALYRAAALVALAAGAAIAGRALARGELADPGAFFGAGALVLVAGLAATSARLIRLSAGNSVWSSARVTEQRESAADGRAATVSAPARAGALSFAALAVRGCARRRSRSVSTVAMLACGVFLIVSIAVFRLDARRDAWNRASGTGGFALVGETTMPVVHDLNTRAGRDFFALRDEDMENVQVVALRVREGDDASCLNLNRAQRPRLLGVKPELLEGRFTFVKGAGWRALRGGGAEHRTDRSDQSDRSDLGGPPPEVPAIGDANSIRWAMNKQVGDTLDYVDERGQPFRVRIVGAVANSILQGGLLIDEAELVRRFPGSSGYRMFLIDAPSNRVAQVSATLSRALEDAGLELVSASERLAQFNAVQNTYLGTFQVLGGLGLLLGSGGLGIVVLRNALERRGELALLLAVGFRRRDVQRLLLLENSALLAAGLGLGIVAAAVAVWPAVVSAATPLPWTSLGVTLAAVLANGLLWTWAATRLALRGDLLEALRNE